MTTKQQYEDALHQLKQLASGFSLSDARVQKLVTTVNNFVEALGETIREQTQLIDRFNADNRALLVDTAVIREKLEQLQKENMKLSGAA